MNDESRIETTTQPGDYWHVRSRYNGGPPLRIVVPEPESLTIFAAPPPAQTQHPPSGETSQLRYLGGHTSASGQRELYDENYVTRSKGWAYLRNMDEKNATLAAAMRTRINMIARRGWDVLPASEDEPDVSIANFVKNATARLRGNFELDVIELLEGLKYGYAISEKVWDAWTSPEYGERWVMTALKDKPQEDYRFLTDKFGNIKGLTQTLPTRITHDPAKFVIFTFQGKSWNPYGKGLYQQAYWHDLFMRQGWQFWATHLERFGSPVVKATVAPSVGPTERTTIEDIIVALQTRTGVIVPEGVALEYMEAVRGGRDSYGAFEDEHRRAIITLILGQELTTQVGDSGSRALGETQSDVLDQIIDADCVQLYAALNEQYVRQLVDVNFAGVQKYPVMAPPIKDGTDLAVLAGIVEKLVNIGQPVGTTWISERFGVPMPEADEVPLKRAAPVNPFIPPGQPGQEPGGEPAEAFQATDESPFWREPELFEDGPSLRKLAKDMHGIVVTASKEARPIFRTIRNTLLAQVAADGILDRADIARLSELRVDIVPLTDLLTRQTVLAHMIGAESGVREIRKAGGEVTETRFADEIPDEDEVLRDFRARVPMTMTQWRKLTAAARLRAFTIGGGQRDAVIKVFHDAILETLDNGLGLPYFKSAVTLNMATWTDVPLGMTESRIDLIFRNATASAINQGREAIFDRPMSDPVVAEQYSAIMDDRVTPLCAALDGKIQSRAAWKAQSLLPPNHHNCRSMLIPILESQAAEIPGDRLMRKLPIVDGATAAPAKGFGGSA